MPDQSEKQARAEAILGELAELGLMVARELAVRVRQSEDATETVALAGAYQKATRAVRLTLALDFKLDRDAAREARAARQAEVEAARAETARAASAAGATPWTPTPTEARKARVGALLRRLLWNEAEGDAEEFEVLQDDVDARLDEAALSADFETLPIETLARRVIADMGLSEKLTLSLCEATSHLPRFTGEGDRSP